MSPWKRENDRDIHEKSDQGLHENNRRVLKNEREVREHDQWIHETIDTPRLITKSKQLKVNYSHLHSASTTYNIIIYQIMVL